MILFVKVKVAFFAVRQRKSYFARSIFS